MRAIICIKLYDNNNCLTEKTSVHQIQDDSRVNLLGSHSNYNWMYIIKFGSFHSLSKVCVWEGVRSR